jgi:hypothetical protein
MSASGLSEARRARVRSAMAAYVERGAVPGWSSPFAGTARCADFATLASQAIDD